MNPIALILDVRGWLHRYRVLHGEAPLTVPLTIGEVNEIAGDAYGCNMVTFPASPGPPRFFGVNVEETPFAESMRSRRLEVPLIRIGEAVTFEPYVEQVQHERAIQNILVHLEAVICCHSQAVDVTAEIDPALELCQRIDGCRFWPFKKRCGRLLRWLFPIKKVTVRIRADVLYPYIKVPLPHNRHTVKLRQVSRQ